MAKYKFADVYSGPRGPHLNHLTKMSLTGTRESPSKSVSIHPKASAEGRSRMEKEEG